MRYEEDISKYYYPMILDWIRSNPRKGSSTAFTSGLGRNIAYLIEVALEQQRKMTKSEDYMVSDQKRQELIT